MGADATSIDDAEGIGGLRVLWRKRLCVLLENLVQDQREHEEIHNVADHIGADYHGRFLIELIQNANDQSREPNGIVVIRRQ